VSTVVVAGCGSDTARLDRDGGAVAATTTTTDDALSSAVQTPAPRSGSPSVLAETATPSPTPAQTPSRDPAMAVPSTPASTTPASTTRAPAASPDAGEPEPSPLPVSLPAPLHPEVLVPDAVSINAARVVVNQSVNQSNVAVNTGGSSSSSARSVVKSDAAVLVVQGSPSGIEVVSLEVRPGWVEAARSQTSDRLTLRYVLGTAAVDISVWANGSGLASSVSSSFDR
jgi:hypothetical protein